MTRHRSRWLAPLGLCLVAQAAGCQLQGRTPFWPCDRAPRCVSCNPNAGVCGVPGPGCDSCVSGDPSAAASKRGWNPFGVAEASPRGDQRATGLRKWFDRGDHEPETVAQPGRASIHDDDAPPWDEPPGHALVPNPVTLGTLETDPDEGESSTEQTSARAKPKTIGRGIRQAGNQRPGRASIGPSGDTEGRAVVKSNDATIEPWPYRGLNQQGQPVQAGELKAQPVAYPHSRQTHLDEDIDETAGWTTMPEAQEPGPDEPRGQGKIQGLFALPVIQPGPAATRKTP